MATIKENGSGTLALAAFDTDAELAKHEIGRPNAGPDDVTIEIKYCGMCHSDVHACNGDWGMDNFPIAPGHEIAGVISDVGDNVKKGFKVGDRAGVGCFVDSCGECEQCKEGQQNYCAKQIQTYSTPYQEGKGHDDCAGCITNGGYTTKITVRSDFVYAVPDGMDLEMAGPLLCAGITMFGPLNRHVLQDESGKKKSVAIMGFGGLGHMGAKLAKAMNCDVTLLSRSEKKKDAAEKLGASILAHSDEDSMKEAAKSFDIIIDTVAAPHKIDHILPTLKVGGTFCCIGAVPEPTEVSPMALIFSNYHMEGSLVGGIEETQQMLDFCAEHKVYPDIKVIHAKDANGHFQDMINGEADAIRAVIDMSTLSEL